MPAQGETFSCADKAGAGHSYNEYLQIRERAPICRKSKHPLGVDETATVLHDILEGWNDMKKTLFILALATTLAATSLSGMMNKAIAEERGFERTITLIASGQVKVEPDLAVISTGVTSEGETAREALTENSSAMTAVIKGLKAEGIDPRDIQTTNFSVSPKYRRFKDRRAPVISGYTVTNSVQITVRELPDLGKILDKVVSLGSNQIGSIQFNVSNADELKDAARKQAIANGLRKAKLLAKAAGARIGQVIKITEKNFNYSPRIFARNALEKAPSAPIEAGTQTLSVSVAVVWELD